ncbi:MAG: pyrroloquinoline-quinone synthase [Chloroflexota bacterium]|jgi:pyrroloquinoline-quinone synthase|nr:pyrroloquinoline-quinone synthase [Chloroflexota bacterium]
MEGDHLDYATPELRAVLDRWDLLRHPFYTRWKAGELTRDELVDYAGQYAHVVRALPRWLEAAADAAHAEHRAVLREHAHDEAAHPALWDQFAAAVGADAAETNAEPNDATRSLLAEGEMLTALGLGAAVAWSLEAQSPEVSKEKLHGLAEHYDITDTGAEYFSLHAEKDVEHRQELGTMIAGNPHAVEAADAVLSRLWDLLSSVERPPAA